MSKQWISIIALGLAAAVLVRGQSNTFPSSGNVGIGTTSPGSKLEIAVPLNGADGLQITRPSSPTWQLMNYGPFYIQEGGIGPRLVVAPGGNVGIGTSGPGAKLELWKPSASPTLSAYCGTLAISQPDLFTSLQMGGYGSAPYGLWLQGTNNTGSPFPILLNPLGGGVGIGTVNPDATMQLRGSDAVNPTALTIQNTNAGGAALRLERSSGIEGGSLTWDNNNVVFNIQTGVSVPMAFKIGNGGEKMRIDATGNVGIGTSSPTQKLSVNGTVRAKEIIVDTSWSDYIFDPAYQLAPLSEVERQIKSERHLAGIPSAKQVSEKGVSLGEMQALLLAKIEELTLRQIEQEKEIDALKLQLQQQKNLMN